MSETAQNTASYHPDTVLLFIDAAPYVEFPARTMAPRPTFDALDIIVVKVLVPSRPATLVIEVGRSDQSFFVRRHKPVRGDEILPVCVELPVPRVSADARDAIGCFFSILRFDFEAEGHEKAGGRDL